MNNYREVTSWKYFYYRRNYNTYFVIEPNVPWVTIGVYLAEAEEKNWERA